MALVTALELMQKASYAGYAIPAFNIDNLESALAVSHVMAEMKLPVIVQTIPRTLAYGGTATYAAIMKALMASCDTDYCLHLDHGNGLETAKACIEAGYSSVMFDGSALPFERNIASTSEVTDYCLPLGISVEGELGTIGGKEEGDTELEAGYTKVSEAVEFVERTRVSTLAIGVGTAHGIYKGIPKINVKRITEIHSTIPTPLVLHGASGLSDKVVRACVAAGISKINFATELRQAYTAGIRSALAGDPDVFDPKLYMPAAIASIEDVLRQKIKLCYGV